MTQWFTADQHFCHRRILHYEPIVRQFDSIQAMDDFMIDQWNKQVQPNDIVYHLGDFALAPKSRKKEIVSELHGYKISILGNHDAGCKHMIEIGFDEVYRWLIMDLKQPEQPTKSILLVHEASGFLDPRTSWDYVICGHVHSNWLTKGKAINVGVDKWVFKPIDMSTIMNTVDVHLVDNYTCEISRKPISTGGSAFLELKSVKLQEEEM